MEPMPVLDERDAWRAIERRDARRDGDFVYGVRTTGIACRPSCPSRRPKRENVQIFATREDALRAGYRACARCGTAPAPLGGAVANAVAYLDGHVDGPVTLAALARAVGLSPSHVQRIFTRAIGVSPRRYLERRRLELFKDRVRAGDSVGSATYAAGFGSSRGLYESAGAGLGMTPGAYRRQGRGTTIRFTVARSRLGTLLVAVTERGVCAVHLGASEPALVEALAKEFPAADRVRDDAALARWAARVAEAAEGAAPAVPLDLRGTAFQLRVWRALQEIPRGETRSYAEVAAGIGQPGAARAVARACAANRVALLVPCHRVVRGDGTRSGYRWGAERKRTLLAAEAARRATEPA